MALIIALVNRSGLAPVSNYTYEVLVGDGSKNSRVIARGEITGHIRDEGWQKLVQLLLDKEKI